MSSWRAYRMPDKRPSESPGESASLPKTTTTNLKKKKRFTLQQKSSRLARHVWVVDLVVDPSTRGRGYQVHGEPWKSKTSAIFYAVPTKEGKGSPRADQRIARRRRAAQDADRLDHLLFIGKQRLAEGEIASPLLFGSAAPRRRTGTDGTKSKHGRPDAGKKTTAGLDGCHGSKRRRGPKERV